MASVHSDCNFLVKDCLTLHEMFRIVGDQLTPSDVNVLKFIYPGLHHILHKAKDGYSFLLGLEKLGRVDESNFKHILHLLKILTRHDLSQHLTLRRRNTVQPDPVDEYLEESKLTVTSSQPNDTTENISSLNFAKHCDGRLVEMYSPVTKRRRRKVCKKTDSDAKCDSEEIRTKVNCDIRLRVRAEYCQHDSALEGNVFSNKAELIERQFEKFAQANTILKSRDLGSIICDIKFTELTYLDAFWRDYINGSLLEALKVVFITESLKQAVGHEAIKLLVNVDEDDYEAGRLILLENLAD